MNPDRCYYRQFRQSKNFANKIKCIYIDPPYNTGNAFEHYDDGIEHSLWLSLMKPRIELLRNLLKDDGSLSGFSYGSYAPDYEDLLNRYTFFEGEFDITEVDTIKQIVNGTFKGKVTNSQGKSFEITDGKIINGELKPGIQKF